MATAQTQQSYPCERRDCAGTYDEDGAVAGSFCSQRCHHIHSLRKDGANLLRSIEYDHRWCHGCFRRLKEIEKARPRDPDFVVGYQYLTRHARKGESEGRAVVERHDRRGDAVGPRPPSPTDRLTMTGTICTCGTTDHRDDYLRQESVPSASAAAKRLCHALVWTGHEGQHDKSVDARVLARTLRESATEFGEWDWPLAVGAAIQD